jgi:hypothetical protein
MTDAEFLHQIETCTLPKAEFSHRNHLRLAWLYLRSPQDGDPAVRIAATIQRYATSLGATKKFDHGLTLRWLQLVAAAMTETSAETFDALLVARPELLDSTLPAPRTIS